ncbi:ribosomal-protein-alanine N-acetyltransferase [Streptococcus gallinaceus]|uniref:ribosomal protein S18-alanine N-acetyltransferase n=1 Tax=Streptococcus gallinaceus TaxID=165758 RepID=UPI0020A042D3|nr:ribosomal protein S18-alanine N-acetyltransferase [Streptococcus gallinaceus]MCP1639911.1 ribosomal-protein-alanine N-acetyltransferase [Streptococcus gallinaceus]MCP1770717.1 ribosomal-protein-alanine N-acetyltransferase [Streptococcus gallinaceus]
MADSKYVEAVWEILSDVYPIAPWNKEQIAADMDQTQTQYFFVEQDGEIVGFLAVQDLADELEITNIAVKTAYQGQGLAGHLLEQLQMVSGSIFLEVREGNLAARALYQKYSFKQIGLRKNYYHAPVENAVIMERKNEG